jgi:single-strand DNA-binding protein
MANYNRVILMGNLTRDPQLKYLPNNTAVCEFGMAINRTWRDRDGNQREEVCFVDVSAFARSAEVINQYMSKGQPMLVEGRLKYDTWTGQDGQKRSKHSVVVDNFQFVGGRGGSGQGGGGYDRGQSRPGQASGYDQAGPTPSAPGTESEFPEPVPPDAPAPTDSDIPF